MVEVVNGVNTLSGDLDGKTVAVVRRDLRQAMNIDPQAKAVVNGDEVDPQYTLSDGDSLEFVKASGQKG